MTATMSPSRRASSKSWVTCRVVMPSASCSARNSRRSTVRVAGSTAANGSSSSSTLGRGASARAIATRCCSPPLRPRTPRSSRLSMPRSEASACTRCAACSGAPSVFPPEAVGDVLAHRQVRKEVVLLIDDAEVSLFRRETGHILAVRPHPSREQRGVARDGVEQRGLAAAGGPDDEGVAPGRHFQRDVAAGRSCRPARAVPRAGSLVAPSARPGARARTRRGPPCSSSTAAGTAAGSP